MPSSPNASEELAILGCRKQQLWWAFTLRSRPLVPMAFEDFIQSYRKKLGSPETKPWERAMEASVHIKKSSSEVPKRPTKLKLELIDVDLVRGSTFPKKKSQLPWTFFSRDTLCRVVFLPFRREWWTRQTSPNLFYLLLCLYFMQISSLITWLYHLIVLSPVNSANDYDWLSYCDTLTPVILLFIVAEILTQAECQDNTHNAPLGRYESISNAASIDFDDLASLTDRSCRSSSLGGGTTDPPLSNSKSTRQVKLKRKVKRRISKAVGFAEDIVHWQAKSEVIVEEPLDDLDDLDAKESKGFEDCASRSKGDETTDSGLAVATDDYQEISRKGNADEVLPRVERDDDDMESDVSDVELSRISKARLDESTSDKEATDEETPIQKRLPTSTEYNPSPSFSMSEDDDHPVPVVYPPASSQLIGCTVWESNSANKLDLSVYEITNCIIKQVDSTPVVATSKLVLTFIPLLFAILPVCHGVFQALCLAKNQERLGWDLLGNYGTNMTGREWSLVAVRFNGMVQRYFWGFWFFLFLSVAFETNQQRYLMAKYFGYLTSSRRARRASLPHFRLSKVRNIKTWLCVRSCLKKYGPRKSVDVVVSFSCMSCLICVIFTCFMVVNAEDQFTASIYVWEAMLWLFAVGLFLLRFMMLGSKTNQKFRNSSVLTTEQLNLYLRMEQKPHKKDQLMLVNNVLKLAADLIKEIEHPYRISGFPANPILYNVSRLLILSAFSTLISEICGFKLKLYKLKM